MHYFSLKYFICWKIVILIQNTILRNDILDKSVIFFFSKIFISLGINSLDKFNNVLRRALFLLSISGKNDNWILLSILKKVTICFGSVNFFFMCT